tara:strand:- start:696 stop:2087 length:1392 start_codon:yes stop_codon:yes gene_type:complete
MKIDCILTSTNTKKEYIEFIPLFIRSWQKLLPFVDVKIILISDSIPEEYKNYKDNIILYQKEKNISHKFISQYIRILYPSILNYKNGILISDIDMIPINEKYFTNKILEYNDNNLIVYRNILKSIEQVPICYNVATSKIWSKIMNIKNIDDINNNIKKIFNRIEYEEKKAGKGWGVDQMELYTKLKMSENVIYLVETKFKRLDRGKIPERNRLEEIINNKKVYDYHAEYNNIELNNNIINMIPKYKKDIVLLVIASKSDFYNKLILNHWIRYINYVEDKYENVKIYLIFGKNTNIDDFNIIRENILLLNEEECLIPGIFNKTIKAFDKINLSYDYKYIFRTNLSSFIRIDMLLEKINYVSGIYGVIGNYNGINFVSGAGMLLSKENINYILSNKNKINDLLPDDVALSSLFKINLNEENIRYDFINDTNILPDNINDFYHFRIKNKNRDNDLIIFNKLFEYFK